MSHLTTADVLMIGLATYPALSMLTYIGQQLLPYLKDLLLEETVISYSLADRLYSTKKPLWVFKTALDNYSSGIHSRRVCMAIYTVGWIPFLYSSEWNKAAYQSEHKIFYLKGTLSMKAFREYYEDIVRNLKWKQRYDLWWLTGSSGISFDYEKPYYHGEFTSQDPDHPKLDILYHLSENQQKLVEDLEIFMASKDFYDEHRLNYRKGYLLHGIPGSGKTSFVKYLAQKHKVPLYKTDLTNGIPEKFGSEKGVVFILVEDFDSIFDKRTRIESETSMNLLVAKEGSPPSSAPSGKVTFDTLLNKMSGVDAYANVVWFFTANDISKIDDAIGIPTEDLAFSKTTRPGRLDRALRFEYATPKQKKAICNWILKAEPTTEDLATEMTTSAYEDLCRERALEKVFAKMEAKKVSTQTESVAKRHT